MCDARSFARRLVALAICFGVTAATATVAPPDIAVYGEQSAYFRDGTTPFPTNGGIFEDQQEGDDPVTRLEFNAITGMKNTLGSFPMRHTTFGKYVIVGNGKTTSAGGSVVDQRIGIYDSESKQFCSLLVHANTNASD